MHTFTHEKENNFFAIFLKLTLASSIALLWTLSAQARVYTIGVEDIDYYPLYKTESAQYKGFARDLFDKFGKENGYEFRYESLPVMRLTKYFVDGEVDFKFPDNSFWAVDAKKDVKVIYSGAVLTYTDGVMVIPANKDKGFDQLKTLGVVRGFTPFPYLDHIKDGKVKLQEANNLEGMTNQALSARSDGAYFNVDVAKYFMKNTLKQADALVFNAKLPHDRSTYHLSTISHPDVLTAFDQFLQKNKAWVASLKKTYEISE